MRRGGVTVQLAQNSRSLWGFFAALVLSAFALNWLWDMLQMPAFEEMAGRSWGETALPCARAAVGDVAMANCRR